MSQYSLDLLGRRLTVSDASESLIEWLEDHWHFPEHAGKLESDWTFWLEFAPDPEPPKLREQAKPLEGAMNALEVAWTDDGAVWLLEASGGVRLTLDQENRKVRLSWYGMLEHTDALYQGLCEALRSSGLVPLHASVAVRAGRATAFLGPSGTGKTTTLLRAIAAGWQPLCEDFGWLEPHSQTLYSWDRKLHLLPDTLQVLERLFPQVQADNFDGRKHPVDFSSLAQRAWSSPLHTLAVLERDPAQVSAWHATTLLETLVSFYGSTGLPLFKALRQPFSDLSGELLKRLEGQKLVLGSGELPL